MDTASPNGCTKIKKKNTPGYSRTGCLQCKKLHTKCDEKKPSCNRCLKRNSECTYRMNFISTAYSSSKGMISFSVGDAAPSRPVANGSPPRTPGGAAATKNCSNKHKFKIQMNTSQFNPEQNKPPYNNADDMGTDHVKIPNSKIEASVIDSMGPAVGDMPTPDSKEMSYTLNSATPDTGNIDPKVEHLDYILSNKGSKNNLDAIEDNAAFDSFGFESITASKPPFPLIEKPSKKENSDLDYFQKRQTDLEIEVMKNAVELHSDIFFPQTNIQIFNLLNFDSKNEPVSFFDYSAMDDNSILPRDKTFEQKFSLLSKLDPINRHYSLHLAQNSGNAAIDVSSIPIKDENFLLFIWTIYHKTYGLNEFALFPEERIDELIIILKSLDEDYPIIHTVIRYAVALFMKNLYHRKGLTDLSAMWDTYVVIPSMKPCIDLLNARMNKPINYAECSALAFGAAVLFSPNSTGANTTWKSHLTGVYILLKKAVSYFKPEILDTKKGKYAFALYGITNSLFCRTEVCAYIASESGGVLTNKDELNSFYNVDPFSTYHLLNRQFDLAVGCIHTIYPSCRKITSELIHWKQKNINLSGTHFIKFKFLNKDKAVREELKKFGTSVLNSITEIYKDLVENDSFKKSALKSIKDYKLIFSLENCNKLNMNSLKMYLMVFFLNEDEKSIDPIVEILEDSLKQWYGIPYKDSVGIKCNWAIYYCALIAIVLNLDNLSEHFLKIINDIANEGLEIAFRSCERLEHISRMIKLKQYDNLDDSKVSQFLAY
ncbi:hypothetical protein TPHA_0M00150 [Tetrapisispora phaffii CBS 4417]|uniref:Zn(2)-C6 fungal-type domain-containing protein n=1 Tax=Tetrapisispora phaffii (strain ATCC 24235 / CBS 4417 / NBRC 1672 / NRRL Y-8282 / UCD 70-5) TaxID=1071381 RepID=G8C0T2_TETPH|nr:hypothetical protein TPHA_0M00150 [Tetrapisispora phaffii CBS 4417]CCE65593.1 hypothetical protein TPHA_0M00150 [Tetrapisispora phaffii CBS 4417]